MHGQAVLQCTTLLKTKSNRRKIVNQKATAILMRQSAHVVVIHPRTRTHTRKLKHLHTYKHIHSPDRPPPAGLGSQAPDLGLTEVGLMRCVVAADRP